MSQWLPNTSLASAMANGLSSVSLIGFLVLFFIVISDTAHSESTVYAWQDVSGAMVFSDNPSNAPNDVQVEIMARASQAETEPEAISTEILVPQLPESYSRTVTQGEFAIRLVEELGLAEHPTEEEAADFLTSARISPRLGLWELEQPMSPDLTVRLRRLTVAAADRGWITLSPDQGLLAFDTAAALMGLTIPVATALEGPSDASYPIAEAPPLIYVTEPPPVVYTYYVWTPVAGGFWWHDYLFPGFYVLNVNLFLSHRHGFVFRGHPDALDSHHIGRRFRSHIIDHHVKSRPAIPDHQRIGRSTLRRGSGPGPERTISLPTTRDSGLRRVESAPSRTQSERRQSSPRPTVVNRSIRHQSSPPRTDDVTPKARRPRTQAVGSMPAAKSSPSRPPEPTPAVRSLPPPGLPERNANVAGADHKQSSLFRGQKWNSSPSQGRGDSAAGRGRSGR